MAFSAGVIETKLDLGINQFQQNARIALALSRDLDQSFKSISQSASKAANTINDRGKASSNTLDGMRERAQRLDRALGRAAVGSERFRRLQSALKATTEDIRKAEGAAESLGSSLGAAIGGAGIAAGAAAISGTLLKLGGDLEQTRVAIGVAMQKELRDSGQAFSDLAEASSQAANQLIKDLTEFSNRTPFFTNQVIRAGRALQAFGIHSSELVGTLTQIGDIASGTGKDFNELAIIYGKARVAGTLYAEDINQLVEAGIPVMGEFAKILGTTEGNVKKMASEGKLSFKALETAFQNLTKEGGQFYNLMALQSRTFVGLLSTLGGKLQTLGAEIGETAGSVLKPVLEALIGLVDRLSAAWTGLSKETQKAIIIIGGIALAVVGIIAILPALKLAWSAAMAVMASSTAMATAGLSILIGAIVSGAVIVATNAKRFQEFLEPLNNALFNLADSFMKLWDAAKRALSPLAALFRPIIEGIKKMIGPVTDGMTAMDLLGLAIKPVIVYITAAASWFSFLATVIASVANVIMSSFRVAWEFVSGAFLQVVDIVKEIIGIFQELWKIFGVISKAAGDIWTAIVGPSETAVQKIGEVGKSAEETAGVFETLAKRSRESIDGMVKDFESVVAAIELIPSTVSETAAEIKGFFVKAFREIARIYTEFVEPIIGVGASLSMAFDAVADIFNNVTGEIKKVVDWVIELAMKSDTVRRVVAAIAGAWASITGIVKAVWAKVKIIGKRLAEFWTQLTDRKSLKGALAALRGDFDDGLTDIQNSARAAAKNVSNAIGASVRPEDLKKASDKFGNMLRKSGADAGKAGGKAAKDFIAEFEKGLSAFGRGENTIEGLLKRQFAGMADTMVSFFTGAPRASVGAMKKVLTEEFSKLKDAGFAEAQIKELIKVGMEKGAAAAAAAVNETKIRAGLENKLRESLKKLGVTSKETLDESVGEGMKNGLKAAAKKAGVDAEKLGDEMDLEKAGKSLGLKGKDLTEFLGKGMGDGLDKAAQIGAKGGEGIVKSIGGGMKGALGGLLGMFSAIKDAIARFVDNWFKIIEARIKLIQEQIKQFEHYAGIIDNVLKKQNEEELARITDTENKILDALKKSEEEKIRVMEAGFLERQRMRDAELDAALTAAEKEHAVRVELQRQEFAARTAELEQAAATEAKRITTKEEREISWNARQQALEDELQAKLEEIRNNYETSEINDRTATDAAIEEQTRASAENIANLEKEKDARLNLIKKQQEQREKDFARATAMIKWQGQLAAFESQKRVDTARAGIDLAKGLLEAAKLPITFGSQLGPPGVVIGLALAAALGSQLAAVYNLTIRSIAASRPLPPAELFMQAGGPVTGPRHSAGGVRAELEGGEFVVNRRAAAANRELLANINRGASAGNIVVQIDRVELNPEGRTVEQLGADLGRAVRRYAS